MKRLSTIVIVLLTAMSAMAQKVTSLSQISSSKKYVLENTNGYGYAVYNPAISDKDVELGGATVDHPSGCKNDLYRAPVDKTNANNLWKLTPDGSGAFFVYNLGAQLYLTNASFEWDWWAQAPVTKYTSYFFTDQKTPVDIIPVEEGMWALRLTSAATAANAENLFLCAASHSQTPMEEWKVSDAGSTWYIKAVDADGNVPGEDNGEDKGDEGGDDTPGGNTPGDFDPSEDLGPLRYFNLTDGQLVVIPEKFIEGREENDGLVTIKLTGDTVFTYKKGLLASEETSYQGDLPVFESFKFNNKFNDQLHTDVDGVIDNEQNTIDLTVGCIGKRLTASFKVPEGAHAYVNNKEQHSKVTRRRFDEDVIYTLAYPKNWIYRVQKLSDAVMTTPPEETEEPWIITPLTLTADMLSSNWPSTDADQQIAFVLDGNTDTYFHSNWRETNDWKEGAYYGDGETTWPYLQIELPEAVENFQFSYTTRNWETNGGYAPQGFIILGSQDGEKWDEISKLDKEKNDMPIGASKQYTSPVILLGQPYKHVRLQLTESTRKNYLVLSEFAISKVVPNPDYGKSTENFVPEVLVPAVYKQGFMPFGRDYRVHVDYLSDHSTTEYSVPRIDITFGNGSTWDYSNWIGRYGKTYWEDATIRIDGGGVFPDMEETAITVRGRGNSSWDNNPNSKNPYRIKFPEKVKPFGMTKGKNWVLLANKQSGSLTTNAIAMKIADMVESAACNHIIPVELYVNGIYRGSYNFTEKAGFANNSISLDDETNAAMIEMDSYYDEAYKFKSNPFNLPVNIKAPDFTDPTEVTNLTMADIQASFNSMANGVRQGDFETYIDVDMLTRAMLVTDLTRNTETQHPKSWNLYNPDVLNNAPWVFGPVWDFDWSYGYEGHSQYFQYDAERSLTVYSNPGNVFFKAIFENSEAFKKAYYRLWTNFLKRDCMGELIEFCDDYLAYAERSFKHNATKWSDGNGYNAVNTNAKNWLTKRANWIYSHLQAYDLSDDIDDTDEEDFDYGQPDRINLSKVVNTPVDVYTLQGLRVRTHVPYINYADGLIPGIYVVNGKKVLVK